MAEQRLRSVVVKKYNHHANHGSIPDDKVNILKRDFETETINQKCGKQINIEVQRANDDNHQKRVRYNGAMQANMTEESYQNNRNKMFPV